ncbi:MAG: hypothetical protein EOP86_00815 [Verrucomicrobiaceae bacterium]|nr:MAG: hypothetical protein EOP86_00815 [Verrucomicrobiaceae bacterium]
MPHHGAPPPPRPPYPTVIRQRLTLEHIYLQRAAKAVRSRHPDWDDQLLQYLSPLWWEHINLSGDYLGPTLSQARAGKLRPLRRKLEP